MRATVLLLVLVVATLARAEAVDAVPFGGSFHATAGAESLGAYPGGLSSPRGWFDVPAGATSARLDADWTPDSPAGQRLLLRACEGWCAEGALLAEVSGVPPLALDVTLPVSRNLTWEALVASGATVDSRIEGVATFGGADVAVPRPVEQGAGPRPFVVLGALAVLALLARVFAARPLLIVAALYHRLTGRDLLDQPVRARIHEEIRRSPGIHFRALREATGLAQGALDHHARLLAQAGLVVEHREAGARCFALPGALEPGLLRLCARVRSSSARAILRALQEAPAASVRELAGRLRIAESTLDDHLARLANDGVVERARIGARTSLKLTPRGHALARAVG